MKKTNYYLKLFFDFFKFILLKFDSQKNKIKLYSINIIINILKKIKYHFKKYCTALITYN